MTETAQLIATLKRLLKDQGLKYRDLAPSLGLSEASVKRLFASERFTVERLVEVAHLLGFTLAELSQEAAAGSSRLRTLTEAQERELVSDIKLLLVAACVLNQWALADILAAYRLNEAEALQYLLRLDKLRLIDLLPGNRIRLNIARDFDWRPNGPIRDYFRNHWLHDFMDSGFNREEEVEAFAHGMFTEQALTQMQGELKRVRQRFAELHAESLAAPLAKRRGTGLMLAMREWEPAAFADLRR
ncbi:MAG: helix-turn-helix transcriptional regulator [Betaproteobacteria bacterium]|nr:helix-turn-helix transcriptional regulator [Betaproteobacteria bacterium]